MNQIAVGVDSIYKLGGGKSTILVDFPSGIDSYVVQDRSLKLTLNFGDEQGDAYKMTTTDITGDLTIESGFHQVTLEMLDTGVVQISVGGG